MKKHLNIIAILLFLYIQQFQLSYSATVGLKNNLTIALPWVLLNILIVALPFLIGLLIVRQIKWAILCNIFLMTLLSVLNYHILLFHGSPFFAGDMFSIPTALNVVSEYTVVLDSIVKRLLVICAVEVFVWYLIYYKIKEKYRALSNVRRYISMLLLVLNMSCIFILFLSPFAIFEKNLFSWSWGAGINQYGYGVCLCNSIYAVTNFCSQPENYTVDDIVCHESDDIDNEGVEKFPDVILILNETLADLDLYTNMEESEQIFSKLNKVEGVVQGYTVSSLVGGGTNNSEYELLTSNSMQVLNASAPFLSLNMTKSTSIVSYLNELDYTTVGMHCGNASNYNRNNAYASMGFDKIKLGKDAFEYYGKNGNRPWLDSDNYKDLIQAYETCDDNPRFIYLLTYQNHGGYEQNDDSQDTIAVKGNYGDYTDDINEYLTSIDQSVDAFLELIQYFEDSERDVVVMMLGDHMPAFISDVKSDKGLTSEQQEIAKRTVPYYVWSNRKINSEIYTNYASMVDLVPLMLKSVEMPLTGYYKTIIELSEIVPIRTSMGGYMDKEGVIGKVVPENKYYDIIQNYYYLEYNNLLQSEDYNPKWFRLENNIK